MTQSLATYHAGGDVGFLLIHGMSGTPVEMRYISNGLAKEGYTVSVPQLAGHCSTYEELKRSTWQEWLASVEAALEAMRSRCSHVFVGGLSMGAVLALKVAARNPDIVRGVVSMSPTLWLDGWNVPLHARLFKLVTTKWFANLMQFGETPPYGIKDERLRALIAQALESGDPGKAGFLLLPGGLLMELRGLVSSVKRDLSGINQPVLIIHPRDDDRASLANVVYLQKRLPGRVDAVVLEDSYHLVTLDRQRNLVLARTLDFARSVMASHERRSRAPTASPRSSRASHASPSG
jgi:carboxylesterase